VGLVDYHQFPAHFNKRRFITLDKTQKMINEAVQKALNHLKQFELEIGQLPDGEEKLEQGRDWLWSNGVPSVWPKCINCKETMLGFPLIYDKETCFEVLLNPVAAFEQYFNSLVGLRTCWNCGHRHQKI